MANKDARTGLSPVEYLNGAPYNGQARKYYMPDTDGNAVFIGSVVKLAVSGADPTGKFSAVTRAAVGAGETVVGVVVGVDPLLGDGALGRDAPLYRPIDTERYVWVADDPQLLFAVQEVSGGTPIAADQVGLNANLVGVGGDSNTGLSFTELNNVGVAITNTLDVSIHRLTGNIDNELGEHAKWLVRLNNHQYVDGTTGV